MLPKLPTEKQQEWAQLTDNNDHQLVRIKIAEWLIDNVDRTFMLYMRLFLELSRYNNELHCIPHEFLTIECAITDAMLKELEQYYHGKRLVNQINKCL